MSESYVAAIVETSKELSARERLRMKDFTNAQQLDSVVTGENDTFVIAPAAYAIIEVHNEKSKDKKDYRKIVIVDTSDNKFVTGSESFIRNFKEIWEEMAGEPFEIEVYKKPSKNYNGKEFITCSVL